MSKPVTPYDLYKATLLAKEIKGVGSDIMSMVTALVSAGQRFDGTADSAIEILREKGFKL